MQARAASLTVPPFQILSWPAQWLRLAPSHEEYWYDYWKASHDEEFHGRCSNAAHDHGSHSIPPDAELWSNRVIVPVYQGE